MSRAIFRQIRIAILVLYIGDPGFRQSVWRLHAGKVDG